MSLPIELLPGTTIGNHYIIQSLINSGGFGAVYRGIDTSEGNRPCAIKETYDVTPAARRQALMEASVLFMVRSKHLPEVYDALESNGRFYLVMQLIEGQNLFQLLRSRVPGGLVGEQEPQRAVRGPCSEQEVLNWLLPIMDILQELHSRRPAVMHRDIKPGNIILTPQQTAVLVDFGLTKLYDPAHSTQTMTRAVTEGFSPLEQYMGQTTPASDIYALAATMYLLLTNRMPPAATKRGMRDELLAPRLLNPSLSLNTERVLLKALALHAQDRYQSMQDFSQALQGFSFSSHADQTIAVGPPTSQPSLVLPAPSAPTTYATGYAGAQSVPQHPATGNGSRGPYTPPRGGNQYPPPGYAAPGYAPPGYMPPNQQGYMMPQAPYPQKVRPLPTPFNQGCLWGLLQGVLAALLVVSLRQVAYFDLAILMGFGFYALAGFTTTRRGGSFLRGGWAGYWAGVTSTVVFWFTFCVGLLIRLSQYMRAHPVSQYGRGPRSVPTTLNDAVQAVLPEFPKYTPFPQQPLIVNVAIILVAGVVIAFSLGCIGGIVGARRNKAKMAKRKSP